MWPMCFITMVCLWWFDVGYMYGLGKHHGLYITNIITRWLLEFSINIHKPPKTGSYFHIPTHYWSFWVIFRPTSLPTGLYIYIYIPWFIYCQHHYTMYYQYYHYHYTMVSGVFGSCFDQPKKNWPMSRHHIVPRGQLLQGPRSPRRDRSVLATFRDEKHREKRVDFARKMVIFIAKMRCFQWTWWFYMHLLLKIVILCEWSSEHGDSHQVRNGDLS